MSVRCLTELHTVGDENFKMLNFFARLFRPSGLFAGATTTNNHLVIKSEPLDFDGMSEEERTKNKLILGAASRTVKSKGE